jgi:CP family cyanate transporter-like MFS transporter
VTGELSPTEKASGPRSHPAALVVAVAVVAFNLRPAIASVAPVLVDIQRSTGMSSADAGLLTTLPVFAFGICAPLAPVLGRRFGMEETLVGALGLLVVGILARSLPFLGALFAGTLLLGIAIALGNVLVPALIKRDVPERARFATAVYSVMLSAGVAVAAGVTVPLEHVSGTEWRGALALWAVPVAGCLVVWLARLSDAHHDIGVVHVSGRLWRDPLAWQVTAFMGFQSLGFYSLTAWLPSIFEQHGVRAAPAGMLLSIAGFASLPSAFVAPVLASSPSRQRAVIAATVVLNATALAGMLWRPVEGAVAWMVLLGLAQGAAISLALSFIVLRAPSAGRAAELSGMAQTTGYLIASLGPLMVGALHDTTGGWLLPLVVLEGVLALQLLAGLGASRPLVVAGCPGPRGP